MRGTLGLTTLLAVLLGAVTADTPWARAAAVSRPAPELIGGGPWFNTPGEQPLSLAGLRGRVVLVEIWTGG